MSILQTNNLSAGYHSTQILKDITTSFEENQFTCIIGPNGCGKSTLMSLIAGTEITGLNITKGSIFLDGKDIQKYSNRECARYISFLPQSERYAWNYTVFETVRMGRYSSSNFFSSYTKEDNELTLQALDVTGISDLKDRHIFELSGGELQLTLIARSIAQDTKIFILDEPFNSLDLCHQHKLLIFLKTLATKKNLSVIMSLHEINQAPLIAQNIVLMNSGSILSAGSIKEVFTVKNLENTYNCKFNYFIHPEYKVPQIYPI